jgi:hypothetical protein
VGLSEVPVNASESEEWAITNELWLQQPHGWSGTGPPGVGEDLQCLRVLA